MMTKMTTFTDFRFILIKDLQNVPRFHVIKLKQILLAGTRIGTILYIYEMESQRKSRFIQ